MFKLLKKSQLSKPKVSLILLDWNVRESFHICHYLRSQTVYRDSFEILVLEYYSQLTDAVKKFEEDIDTLAVLGMPNGCYYHKHLMYNIGALLAQGEIIVICDSDAMVKPTFIESILQFFETHPNHFLHMDQFRNHRQDLYPFSYPSFEEVIGAGCINYSDGKTTGVVETSDRLHRRNYGACLCMKRDDYFAIGGSDEHVDFVGHICGPYDLTFRLCNAGKEEVWHEDEFLYHTWHPGSDGIGEYLGPHDGYNVSSTSLEAIWTGRTLPHVPHPLVTKIQQGESVTEDKILKEGINATHLKMTDLSFLKSAKSYAQETYRFPLPQKPSLSTLTQLQFTFISLFQKVYGVLKKKVSQPSSTSSSSSQIRLTLPILRKKVSKLFTQAKQEWLTVNQATSGRKDLWNAISRLYRQKTPHTIVVNSKRHLMILSEFILWQGKMVLRPHNQLKLLYLSELSNDKMKELVKEGQSCPLFLSQVAANEWKKRDQLKDLEYETL
ncbi:hypothetical protein [Simkania sp.]|uniref:hypothetical protein n=1 Tax=Simkania sp. TaxID=34094 RepID=UPI003B51FA92